MHVFENMKGWQLV